MFFSNQMIGIIALDIDGTITVDHHPIDQKVIEFLINLKQKGWDFIFITGRTFAWGYEVLKDLPFSYTFAVQNGAILLEMPSRQIALKKYLGKDVIPIMEEICDGESSDFVIYTGFENGDLCYYRAKHFNETIKSYLHQRAKLMNETWIDLATFDELPVSEFPSLKCFGDRDSTSRICKKIETRLGLHVPAIHDPFNAKYFVAQATHPDVDKGKALLEFKKMSSQIVNVIAAGDDCNDVSMLQVADYKVVMCTAPESLLAIADVIAPPAADNGIIEGLTKAIRLAL